MKKMLQIVADCDAQEVAELAIVLPILLSLIIGIYSFGRAYNIYATVTRAAQAGARKAVAPACVTCTPFTCGGTSSGFPCDSDVSQAVKDVVTASHLDVSKIAQPSPTPNPLACPDPNLAKSCAASSDGSNVYICRNVILNSATTSNTSLRSCGTIVSFQYPYEFLPVPFLRTISINIPAVAQVRVEY
jgi:hypothetical protein